MRKNGMKMFWFVSHLEYPTVRPNHVQQELFVSFLWRILNYVLCSSHTLIVFPTCTHIRRNSWLLKHSFQRLCITVQCILAEKNGICRYKSEVQNPPGDKTGIFSYELLPGRNFLKRKLIEICKNDLYIYPCNQETNTVFLVCSMFIFDDSST